ncbi:MAG: fused MFS/spermidine synthase [Gammaproteobacteria bacterium]
MTLVPPKYFYLLILMLYFLSGMSSLSYEILWVRMLSLEFGVSIFGVVVTVAVFMLGLGAGSLLAAHYFRSVTNPLRLFAILECAIAIVSIAIPWIFRLIDGLLPASLSESALTVWYLWQFATTGVVLLVPALLMGGGFPLILRLFSQSPAALGTVYGINTLGAAVGALLPLLLLPALGWTAALYVIVAISLIVAAIAALIARDYSPPGETSSGPMPRMGDKRYLKTLLAYGGIGAVALILEIAWTRLFGMVFLRTEYVLAIILAVFLVGIAGGSAIARFVDHRAWFNALPIIAGGFVMLSLWALPGAAGMVDNEQYSSLGEALLHQGFIIALLTLPVTLVFGAWLPLLNERLGHSGVSGARLYGANAVGSALGALIAGFVLTPMFGTNATIVLAAILTVIISMVWNKSYKVALAVPMLALAGIPVYHMAPVSELMPKLYAQSHDLYSYEDAVNVTHVIARPDGQRLLLADLQRMDASSDPASVQSQKNQSRLPLLLHPYPRRVLYLGLGTGISVSGSLAYPWLDRTAVELSRGAINAASRWFQPVNDNVMDHTTVVRDDARRFLMTRSGLYDVIIGDLFHPDLVGRSALLSRQQFERASHHLTDNGIFVQWIALNQFEVDSLKIVLRTFKTVFPDAVLFVDAFRVALVGSNSELTGLPAVQENLARLNSRQQQLITGGEGQFTWLGRYWGKINVDPAGPIQDEWAPQIEFRLPRARYNGDLDLAKLLHFMLQQRPRVDRAAKDLRINESHYTAFERAYIATEDAHRSWLALLQKDYQRGQHLLRLAYQANPEDRWIGFAVADAALENYDVTRPPDVPEKTVLESVLNIRPDHAEALRRLWFLEKRQGDAEQARNYRDRFADISPLAAELMAK